MEISKGIRLRQQMRAWVLRGHYQKWRLELEGFVANSNLPPCSPRIIARRPWIQSLLSLPHTVHPLSKVESLVHLIWFLHIWVTVQVRNFTSVWLTKRRWHCNHGTRPFCLLDYFPEDYLMIVDESHVTLSQVHAMYGGDRSRQMGIVFPNQEQFQNSRYCFTSSWLYDRNRRRKNDINPFG